MIVKVLTLFLIQQHMQKALFCSHWSVKI